LGVVGGNVFACGFNGFGQLGDGTLVSKSSPVAVCAVMPAPPPPCSPGAGNALAGIVAVSAGFYHSLALSGGGTVFAWGYNAYGQLGPVPVPGPGVLSPIPVVVPFPPGTTIVAIAAGANFSLALDSMGNVWSWGFNGNLELGRPTGGPFDPGPAVALPGGITAIAAGADHALALTGPGGVLCWGLDNVGQCSNGGGLPKAVPAPPMTAIAGGGLHSLAVGGGSVWSWGLDDKGQLGHPPSPPAPVPGLPAGMVAVAAGWKHSLATTGGGAVFAWGWNASGQTAPGAPFGIPTPVPGPCSGGVTLIAAGYAHSLCV
jgi:alpha-tubulin suppressor-like RCC1 family protein